MEHGEAMAALGVCEGGALKEAFAAAGNASFSAHKLMDLQARHGYMRTGRGNPVLGFRI